jgi:hypothetical protein
MPIALPSRASFFVAAGLVALAAMGVAGCAAQVPTPSIGAHADPDLEAQFPNAIHGEPFSVESYADADTLRVLGVDQAFLDAVGVPIGDVSVAVADHDMTSGRPMHLTATAFRARGAQAEDLAAYFLPVIEDQSEGISFSRVRFGDKVVWRPRGNPIAVGGNVLYVRDDTAYLIYGNRRGATNQLLALLP